MTETLDIKGESGDLRIVRICHSDRCQGQERVFNRIGITQDKYHFAYTCERCGDWHYTNTKPQDRIVRLIT